MITLSYLVCANLLNIQHRMQGWGVSMRLKHLKQNTIWPLKMLCAQIHTNLIHACDCLTTLLPSVVKNRKCKLRHIQRCCSNLTGFLCAWYTCCRIGTVKTGWTGQAIFLYTGRSHYKLPLMNNFALMWLEKLNQFLNLCFNFQFSSISYSWFMCTVIFCWRVAGNDKLSAISQV